MEYDIETEAAIAAEGDLPNFRVLQPSQFDVEDRYDEGPEVEREEYFIPDVVRNFLVYFEQLVRERNVHEIGNLYDNSFNKLTERYFKTSPWPPVEGVADITDERGRALEDDPVFLTLYKELYYRHIYGKLQPTLEQRIESFENYCLLFRFILSEDGVELELPNQWLWDITDEFIYQFQTFCQFRSKLKARTEEEITTLKENPQVWNVSAVLAYLQSLVNRSGILTILERERTGQEPAEEVGTSMTQKMLGYFSIVGLCRVHCLLGDYQLALKVLDPIDLNKKGLFTRVMACHITTYYYTGFSFMMLRRYTDATKFFSNILLYINRTKQYHTRSYQYEQMMKKNEQMCALLAIVMSLCPQRIDENVLSLLREKCADKMSRMIAGDMDTFEESFQYACPKFVSVNPPNYDDPSGNYLQEAYQLQLRVFLSEVRQAILLPTIRSYLKLYTTIGMTKLADFLETDEKAIRSHLMCLKHKSRSLTWQGGLLSTGKLILSSGVEFYIDGDMVHIADVVVRTRNMDFFMRHIVKFEELIADISHGR